MRPKSAGFRPLADVVDADAALGAWSQRKHVEAGLTRLARRHLPRALGDRLRVAGIEGDTLIIAVSAGAIAAALRARGPDLLTALRREGCEVTALRVRVNVETKPTQAPTAPSRTLDAAAAASLFDLTARLADGPLKRSLARWSRRARGR